MTAGTIRDIAFRTAGIPASDGDGVTLTRIIGSPEVDMIDPFLLLDCFESDQPDDYIGGFPDHPHRGFETVTYLLDGRMRHKDNAGHEGVIEPGGIQWMTAGRGIVHSEMPEQEGGLLKGFQLWVNLPAAEKMTAPAYQEFPASEIPTEELTDGGTVTVISGRTNTGTNGAVQNALTNPLYLDVRLKKDASFTQTIPDTHNGFFYVIDGALSVKTETPPLATHMLGILGDGDHIHVTAHEGDCRFLLIAGKRLNEPVSRGGPFVMNTRAEVLQAFQDYQNGRF